MLITPSYIDLLQVLEIDHVEFKVIEFGEYKKWEDIKPFFLLPMIDSNETAVAICKKILEKYPTIKEVRWNYAGNMNGNYVS